MSNESRIIEGELVPSPRAGDLATHHGGALDIVGPAAVPPATFDVRRIVHQALRGRYVLSLVLGLIVGGAFGALAWKMGRPVYYSEGIVRIQYSLPAVLGGTENRPLANFEQFMLSQRMVITSRRVIELASQDPVWRQHGDTSAASLVEYYTDNLKVDIRPRSEFIAISVTDSDPGMAAAAVVAMINAYSEYYNQQEKEQDRQVLGLLEDRLAELQALANDTQKQLEKSSQEYGSAQMAAFYDAAVGRLTRLDTALADIRMAIAAAPPEPAAGQQGNAAPDAGPATVSHGAQPPAPTTAPAPANELTAEEIALTDVGMRTHLDLRDQCVSELNRLVDVLRLGEAHRDVQTARRNLANAEARVARYVEGYKQIQAATASAAAAVTVSIPGTTRPVGDPVALSQRSIASLRANEASLLKLHESTKQELVAIGKRRAELDKLTADLTKITGEHETLSRRIEVLRAESRLGGRLSVISSGEVPVAPMRDTRLRNAAAGAMAGTFVPAGLFILLGFVRQRYRYSDETEADLAARVPLLGILPEYDGKDVTQNPAAAHSVHQIRVSLASTMERNRSSVYLVSSATAGEGKTTVAVSLALSFAAAHVRTLLIDCDLVGRHLTSSLDASSLEGMREALKTGSLLSGVRKTHSGLYILTAGQAGAADAVSIPSESVRALFAEARKYFQVIIVDSGPILGSLEAAVVAQEADGVIFAITRGQHRDLVRRALRRLSALGTPIVGFIFNRAKPQDFHRSSYASSAASSRKNPDVEIEPAEAWNAESLKRFSPLVRAVATGLRKSDN